MIETEISSNSRLTEPSAITNFPSQELRRIGLVTPINILLLRVHAVPSFQTVNFTNLRGHDLYARLLHRRHRLFW